VSEELVRFGRVEMVLIENEDAESALEFGQELLTQDGDTPQIRLLLAACLMTLNRPADALEHLRRAVQSSENNPVLQLHALYNVARALHAAGQLREAAEAYERYVTFARTHGSLTSFADEAQRIARVLRGRVEAAR
jgi:predicted Zn-dependent protease